MTKIKLHATTPLQAQGMRLDQVLVQLFPAYSRARLQTWLKNHEILIDNKPAMAKTKVHGGELISINANLPAEEKWQPQAMDLTIVYEDDDLIVINKPMGLVVHPAPGNLNHTLVNALLHHCPQLSQLPRAGIIHRLDKDTSGLLVVAKNLNAHHKLVKQLQARKIKRQYAAIIVGQLTGGGTIDAPIGRHPIKRKAMAVLEHGGKAAITHYRILERFKTHTYIQVQLETGRTHQIRVHFAHLHKPIVGDPTYGRRTLPPQISAQLKEKLIQFTRQALHAKTLGLWHPVTGEYKEWTINLPSDMQDLLDTLRNEP